MKRQRSLHLQSVGVKLFVILFSTILLLSSVLGLTSYYAAKGIITDEVAAASSQAIVRPLINWISSLSSMKRSRGNLP